MRGSSGPELSGNGRETGAGSAGLAVGSGACSVEACLLQQEGLDPSGWAVQSQEATPCATRREPSQAAYKASWRASG